MPAMQTAQQILDQSFLEMRSRCLSLAADLDRIQRAEAGHDILQTDPRLQKLHRAIQVLLEDNRNRAAHVQMIFSDTASPTHG